MGRRPAEAGPGPAPAGPPRRRSAAAGAAQQAGRAAASPARPAMASSGNSTSSRSTWAGSSSTWTGAAAGPQLVHGRRQRQGQQFPPGWPSPARGGGPARPRPHRDPGDQAEQQQAGGHGERHLAPGRRRRLRLEAGNGVQRPGQPERDQVAGRAPAAMGSAASTIDCAPIGSPPTPWAISTDSSPDGADREHRSRATRPGLRSRPVSEMLSTGPVRAARVAWARRTTSVIGVAVVTRASRLTPICSVQGRRWSPGRPGSGRPAGRPPAG